MRPLARISCVLLGALCLVLIGGRADPDSGVLDPHLDVPYVQTPQDVVDQMLALAAVGPDDFLIDLGSGDGRIPITAAKRYGARGFGVDIDPERVTESRENARDAGVDDRVTFAVENLFDTDLRPATVVTMYLLPQINLDLRPRLLAQLRPGARIVSHAFRMGEWKHDGYARVPRYGNELFLWIVPANISGQWRLRVGEQRYRLDLKQAFQEIEARARAADGRALTIQDASLRGDRVTFTLMGPDALRINGRIAGDVIEGRATGPNALSQPWRATRLGP